MGKQCLLVVNKTEYCLYKHVLAYFLHLKWINARAELPDFKMNQSDQLSLSVIVCFQTHHQPGTLSKLKGLRYFAEKTCGYGWSRLVRLRTRSVSNGRQTSVSASHTCDPPFNPLTFAPLDTFAPLIYTLSRHLLKLNVLREAFTKTLIIEENLGKDWIPSQMVALSALEIVSLAGT